MKASLFLKSTAVENWQAATQSVCFLFDDIKSKAASLPPSGWKNQYMQHEVRECECVDVIVMKLAHKLASLLLNWSVSRIIQCVKGKRPFLRRSLFLLFCFVFTFWTLIQLWNSSGLLMNHVVVAVRWDLLLNDSETWMFLFFFQVCAVFYWSFRSSTGFSLSVFRFPSSTLVSDSVNSSLPCVHWC